ncbi:hypothetical protein [Vibrio sp. WXL103]|uniref:hypothetical protein n=1 Tax=Vibrio sp. WXL103 TaxID=3450710 RepID=UPI003EC8B9F2
MPNYVPYLSLTVSHEYFDQSAGSPKITIVPTERTAVWLERHHMFTRSSFDTLTVFCDLDMLALFEREQNEQLLQFKLFSGDHYFRNYTQASSSKCNTIALFQSSNPNSEVSILEANHWTNMQDINSRKDFEPITESDVVSNLIGIACIMEAGSQIEIINKKLEFHFQSIAATWQYYLPSYLADRDIAIINANDRCPCVELDPIQIDNRTFKVFQTKAPQLLKSRSEQCFQLRCGHKTICKRLANADPRHLTWVESEQGIQPVCHIYLR